MPGEGEVLARFESRGHPDIRGTHDATLELAADENISPRATCVIGVATEVVAGSPAALAGRLQFTLECGPARQTFEAVANPWFTSIEGGVVIRRSGARLDDTLATDATCSVADLDRALVERLVDPTARLTVTVRRAPADAREPGQLVIGRVRAQGAKGGRKAAVLGAERAAADAIVADDAAAAQLVRHPTPIDAARRVLLGGGRVLVLGTDELIGRGNARLLEGVAAPRLEAFGMPATLAAAAFVGGTSALALVPSVSSRADQRDVETLVDQGLRVVTTASAQRTQQLLLAASASVGRVVLVTDPDTATERISLVRREEFAQAIDDLAPRGPLIVALGAVDSVVGPERPTSVPWGVIDALARRGVPASTIASALADQPGWSRNRAYDAVVDRGD